MADKTLKEHIISFRIPDDQAELVIKMLREQPILGVRSPNQFFRKLGLDFIAGRLAYKNPEDYYSDTTLLG
jgi:hypothetical protein